MTGMPVSYLGRGSRSVAGGRKRMGQAGRLALPVASLALVAVLLSGCGGSEAADSAPGQPAAAVTIGAVGAVQEGDGVAASIDALRTTDASAMVDVDPSTAEIDTEPLRAGQEFLVIDVTIANVSTAPKEFNGLSWSVTDASGEERQTALMAMTGRDLAAGDLEPGEDVSGDVVMIIPADATELQIAYETELFGEGSHLSWEVAIP